MKKIFLTGLIVAVIAISFFLIYYINNNNVPNNPKSQEQDNSNTGSKEINDNKNPSASAVLDIEDIYNEDNNPSSNTGGGGGGGGNGESGGGNNENRSEEEFITNPENSCILVRPGNFPDVYCYINYIKTDGISLKMKNEFGRDIEVSVEIQDCTPKTKELIPNEGEKNFVFSCINEGYINKEIYITYFLEGKEISVGGFISGIID